MAIPKKLSRRTNHKTPRCQLYQPGFNAGNSCWLDGSWVTVPDKDFDKRAKEHEKLYQGLRGQLAKQHYRDKGVEPKDMTPAQRQAWEHYSGEGRLDVRYETGEIGTCGVGLAADKPVQQSLNWFRQHKAKVIPKVLQPDGLDENGKPKHLVVDQTKGVPKDLLTDDTEPVDVWKIIVKQNQDRFAEMSKAMAEIATTDDNHAGMAAGVAMQGILQLEESIIRLETSKHEDPYETMADLKARYQELRTSLEGTFKGDFQRIYQASRDSHNDCARTNLDNSNGFLACYVLPEFHPDGSHEPFGPRDIPWGRDD